MALHWKSYTFCYFVTNLSKNYTNLFSSLIVKVSKLLNISIKIKDFASFQNFSFFVNITQKPEKGCLFWQNLATNNEVLAFFGKQIHQIFSFYGVLRSTLSMKLENSKIFWNFWIINQNIEFATKPLKITGLADLSDNFRSNRERR